MPLRQVRAFGNAPQVNLPARAHPTAARLQQVEEIVRGLADSHRLLRSKVDHGIKPAHAAESSKVNSTNGRLGDAQGDHKDRAGAGSSERGAAEDGILCHGHAPGGAAKGAPAGGKR